MYRGIVSSSVVKMYSKRAAWSMNRWKFGGSSLPQKTVGMSRSRHQETVAWSAGSSS
jgi:hypothetical protein